jgi:hypothetical protein
MAVAMLASLGLACLDAFFANWSVVGASAASACNQEHSPSIHTPGSSLIDIMDIVYNIVSTDNMYNIVSIGPDNIEVWA